MFVVPIREFAAMQWAVLFISEFVGLWPKKVIHRNTIAML